MWQIVSDDDGYDSLDSQIFVVIIFHYCGVYLLLYLYGAFDRYNYGDVLLPLVFQRFASRMRALTGVFTSLADVDMTKWGLGPVHSIGRLLPTLSPGDSIVLVGGHVLGVSSVSLYFFIHQDKFLGRLARFRNWRFVDWLLHRICKSRFGVQSDCPFNLTRNLTSAKIIYCAVGGWPTDSDARSVVHDALRFSVRSGGLYRHLVDDLGLNRVALCPDLAELMSEAISPEEISSRVSPSVADAATGDYIAVQVSLSALLPKIDEFLERLFVLSDSLSLPIVLSPIGLAHRHNDDVAAQLLRTKCNAFRVATPVTLYDTMYTVSNAKLFVGTSLHGAITAMAFSTPSVSLESAKCQDYLATWGQPGAVYSSLPSLVESAHLAIGNIGADGGEARRRKLEVARDNLEIVLSMV